VGGDAANWLNVSMAQPDTAEGLHGSDLLSRISTEMVRAQKKHFGKGPTSAKSYMVDDFLLIVMRGSRTVAEETMLGFGQENLVRNFRQQFENEMTSRLSGMIEELTGRKVLGYQSQILFTPDVVLEVFFFDQPAGGAEVGATTARMLAHVVAGEDRPGRSPDDSP
jgi:uncharacterized protein YbcI